MFYNHPSFINNNAPQASLESAIVVLNPSESKRLIAKAIAVLPEVKSALQKSTLVISMGTTNAMVAEEIIGKTIENRAIFTRGVVCEGKLNANTEMDLFPIVLKEGKVIEMHQKAALEEFRPGDVFIKGANAVDVKGDVGVLVGSEVGGTVGEAWYAVSGRGGCLICPVGLEKLVPSVSEVAPKTNIYRYKYSMGMPACLIFMPTAKVITEIQAIKVLSSADAYFIASGGVGGSEGAVTLIMEGDAATVKKAFELVKSVKDEPPVVRPPKLAL
ncbi:hypothetical protein ACFLUH_02885 [Chloroflexota bacterium]